MAEEEKTFDLKDEQGKPLAEGKPSPITVEGLTPNTTYKGWKLYYAGKEAGADVPEFKTLDVVPAKPTLSVKAGDAKIDATLTDGANEGSDVTKRQLVLSADGKALTTLDAESGIAKTFTDLTNDKLYSVHAEVTNGAGVVKSDEVEATPKAPIIKMASFKVNNATLSGETGKTGTVKVSDVLPANTTNKLIEATSLDEKVATVKDNGDASYTVTYVAEGTTTINFASVDGGANQEVAVTVKKPVVKMTSFKIDNLEPAGKVGENVKLTLSGITPADTTDKGVDIWVDDTEVATVASNDGNTFTVNLVKEGTTGIHWLAKDGGGAKADGTVTVSASSTD